MKNLQKKLKQGYIMRLKKDLLLLLSHLERLEPRRRGYCRHNNNVGNDIQSLTFLSGEAD